MKKAKLKVRYYILFAFLTTNTFAFPQTNNLKESALKIFFDCDYCDKEFIKNELTYVNYVRDSKEAQVHILVTTETTGNGGNKYSFFFIGQMEVNGQNDTLSFYSQADATSDEIRQKQLQTLKLGLTKYVAKTPLASKLIITYETDEKENEVVKDKWNNWVFNARFSGYFNGEKTYKYSSLYTSLDISRITPDYKFEADMSVNFNKQVYNIDDSLITCTNNSKYFNNLWVKSLNDHWSAGYFISIGSSNYSNYYIKSTVAPAIEYNIFPYSESSRKQVRFLYQIGVNYFDYIDTTLNNKSAELLYSHSLKIATEFKEKWGSVSLSVCGSNYLQDISYNKLTVNSSINLRLFKGLSLRLNGSASLIHDQLNLPKGNASSEDIFLSRKQLSSQYSYYGSVGLSYTFGSIYNNIVNPRFEN